METGVIKTNKLDIMYGVPERSILGPLFSILYVNNLYKVSNILEPVYLQMIQKEIYTDRCYKNE